MARPREVIRVLARRTGWLAGATVAIAYAWMAFRGPQGIQSLIAKHSEIRELEEQNAAIVRQNQALRERIKRLEQSDSEQELEIRKQLKLLRPGETTFLLPESPKGSEAAPSPSPAK
ncbi:MAG TPA: septum formation initiator family protein [Bryobacteraceae bacterium]|jgi:cell division protein FtsB